MANFKLAILGLVTYIFPVDELSKKKRVMRHETRNLRKLKLRYYTNHIIEINKYLDSFPGIKSSDKLVIQN